jgi:multiple sugar transport system substrate-binding protein
MKETSFTQLAIIGVIIMVIMVALGLFTGVIPTPGKDSTGQTTVVTSIWIPKSYDFLERIISEDFSDANENVKVATTIVPDEEYETRLLDALASGVGPEIWFLPHGKILANQNKAAQIPFTIISERQFMDTFIEGALLYLYPGIAHQEIAGYINAIPILVDPLILYWNKDLLGGAGIPRPPATWNEYMTAAQKLTVKNAAGNFVISGAAMGEFSNIRNAKEIISLFILQANNPIVETDTKKVVLGEQSGALSSAVSAIRFWNEFTNPRKEIYSWNHLMPSDQEAFAAQKLALYIGFASEYPEIAKRNPHLNFDVAEVPQIQDDATAITYGRFTSLAITKTAANSSAAWQVVNFLTGQVAQSKIASAFERPSVRRDVLGETGQNSRLTIYSRAAVKARAWLDPNELATYRIIKDMVESVKTGAKDATQSVQTAQNEIQLLISNK